MSRFWVLLLFCIQCLSYQTPIFAQQPLNAAQDDPEARVQRIALQLEPFNPLRVAIENGERGDGIHFGWMNEMKSLGVKRAIVTVRFVWTKNNRLMRIVGLVYLGAYYPTDYELTGKKFRDSLTKTNLEQGLVAEAFRQVSNSIPDLLGSSQFPQTCGEIQVDLLDDEALPVPGSIPTLEHRCPDR